MKSDIGFNLYKYAAAPALTKTAKLNAGVTAALIGAAGGGGLGLLSHLLTPKDEDEDQRKRLLSHVLAGAAAGGLAGYGANRLGAVVKDTPLDVFSSSNDKEKSRAARVLDPGWGVGGTFIGGLASTPFLANAVNEFRTGEGRLSKVRTVLGRRGRLVAGPGSILKEISDIGKSNITTPLSNTHIDQDLARRIHNEALSAPGFWRRVFSRSARREYRALNYRLFDDIYNALNPKQHGSTAWIPVRDAAGRIIRDSHGKIRYRPANPTALRNAKNAINIPKYLKAMNKSPVLAKNPKVKFVLGALALAGLGFGGVNGGYNISEALHNRNSSGGGK